MNKLLYPILIGVVLTTLLAGACRKGIMTYNSPSYVYFTSDSTAFSFASQTDSTLTQDTVIARVALIGNLADHDRAIQIGVVADSTTAVEGTDYKILQPFTLQKDSAYMSVKILIYRTDTLKAISKTLSIQLTNASELLTATFADSLHTTFKLRFSDKLEQPTWWNGAFGLYGIKFSVTRYKFYIAVLGTQLAPSQVYPALGTYSTAAAVYNLKAATAEYNATHSTPLSDEYGPISWSGITWIEY